MKTLVKLLLPEDEYAALLKRALSDLRTPPDEARYILRREFERCGLLPTESGNGNGAGELAQPVATTEGGSHAAQPA